MIKPAGGPIEIGMQVLIAGQHVLNDSGGFFPLRLSGFLRCSSGVFFQNASAHVAGLVDAMAKTHHSFLARQCGANPFFRVLRAAGRAQQVHDLFVGPTV